MKFRKICFFLVLCIGLNPNLAFARDLNYSEHEPEDNFIPNNLTVEEDKDISNSQEIKADRGSASAFGSSFNTSNMNTTYTLEAINRANLDQQPNTYDFNEEDEDVLNSQEIGLKTGGGSLSGSSLDPSKYNDFSIVENINLFLPSNINNDYTLIETYSTDLVQEPYTYGYGVVKIFRSNSDPKLFNISMDSNIKGNKVSKFEKYKVTNMSWEISSTNDKINVVEWSPKETTVEKTDDIPIPPLSNRGFKKIFGVNLLNTFKFFNKNDKITEYGIGQKYKVNLEIKKNTYDRVQHLSADIVYQNDSNEFPRWNWNWNWSWLKYAI